MAKKQCFIAKGRRQAWRQQHFSGRGIPYTACRGGYLAWLMGTMDEENEKEQEEETPFYLEVEQSIRKRFKKRYGAVLPRRSMIMSW